MQWPDSSAAGPRQVHDEGSMLVNANTLQSQYDILTFELHELMLGHTILMVVTFIIHDEELGAFVETGTMKQILLTYHFMFSAHQELLTSE